jgi:hypothetical protein
MDERGHPAQANSGPKPQWPPGVRSISVDGLSHIGVGNDGSLYWDGKPIEVRKTLNLSWWQRAGAIAVAISAVVGAGAATVSAWSDIATESCQSVEKAR